VAEVEGSCDEEDGVDGFVDSATFVAAAGTFTFHSILLPPRVLAGIGAEIVVGVGVRELFDTAEPSSVCFALATLVSCTCV